MNWTVVVSTIGACFGLYIAQGVVMPLLLVILGIPFIWPSRLVVKTIPVGPEIEQYAAEHPWRIHAAALLFRWGLIVREIVAWLVVLYAISLLSDRWGAAVSWWWVYAFSFLIFLQALNNARTLNSQYNSLSFRLKGGNSELRYQHGARDLPPDEVLGPIAVTRRGF